MFIFSPLIRLFISVLTVVKLNPVLAQSYYDPTNPYASYAQPNPNRSGQPQGNGYSYGQSSFGRFDQPYQPDPYSYAYQQRPPPSQSSMYQQPSSGRQQGNGYYVYWPTLTPPRHSQPGQGMPPYSPGQQPFTGTPQYYYSQARSTPTFPFYSGYPSWGQYPQQQQSYPRPTWSPPAYPRQNPYPQQGMPPFGNPMYWSGSQPYPGANPYPQTPHDPYSPFPSARPRNDYPFPYGRARLEAKAIMKGAEGTSIDGEIVFTQINNGDTTVKVRVSGLPGGQGPKGLHILNSATCPPLGAANLPLENSVVHLNPRNSDHGARTAPVRHLGDLGNVMVMFDGMAVIEFSDNQIGLTHDRSILNRAIVITENEDDIGLGTGNRMAESRRTGNSGRPIACGVITMNNNTTPNPHQNNPYPQHNPYPTPYPSPYPNPYPSPYPPQMPYPSPYPPQSQYPPRNPYVPRDPYAPQNPYPTPYPSPYPTPYPPRYPPYPTTYPSPYPRPYPGWKKKK